MCWRWTACTPGCCTYSKHGLSRMGVWVPADLGRQISKTMLIKSAAGLAWCGADWWRGPLPPGSPELWLLWAQRL
nr:MAG TPA: hypothetical protein [Caudoviricetes sp.]